MTLTLTAAAILTGLLMAGVISATMPWTASIFGLVLFSWVFNPARSANVRVRNTIVTKNQ